MRTMQSASFVLLLSFCRAVDGLSGIRVHSLWCGRAGEEAAAAEPDETFTL